MAFELIWEPEGVVIQYAGVVSRCGEVMGSSAFREDTECGRLAARTAG